MHGLGKGTPGEGRPLLLYHSSQEYQFLLSASLGGDEAAVFALSGVFVCL